MDPTGDRYTAQLQVRNHGEAISRQVVVVFPELPEGVTLLNASGVDGTGNPYVNLSGAIARGGLASGAFSDAIAISFSNPGLEQFAWQPQVWVGGANQAPVFEPIGDLTVRPGDRLEVVLAASDPNGDGVTYQLKSEDALPTGALQGHGGILRLWVRVALVMMAR